ncbi:MAG: DUF937 domain-containing protein [Anaerolineales bacterium]
MDSLMQLLLSQLGGDTLGKISKQIGVDESQTQKAVGLALPMLIGALNRNTSSTDGAQALAGALQRDHDGSILDNLAQAVQKPETLKDGSAILGHVLDDKQGGAINSVSRATNLDPQQVSQIFAVLAPIVLGGLGQMQRKKGLDQQGLANLLQEERSTVERTSSGFTQLLDLDGDGDVSEEIVSLGANLLGGLFGGKQD